MSGRQNPIGANPAISAPRLNKLECFPFEKFYFDGSLIIFEHGSVHHNILISSNQAWARSVNKDN
jgi:hypothetical protein